ncbi:PREDICTED: uncharacterized protein LOC102014895 [Chinchilla lanigera]|uniref:uncharacterized protein LOC102014895 n=1 Tax=Chinchilla lanigera TaxID=34839 RepID=UPI0006981D72|nr:PREDICTED: uncharacterized protein LOC102014895 [Chinchilla lanigera]
MAPATLRCSHKALVRAAQSRSQRVAARNASQGAVSCAACAEFSFPFPSSLPSHHELRVVSEERADPADQGGLLLSALGDECLLLACSTPWARCFLPFPQDPQAYALARATCTSCHPTGGHVWLVEVMQCAVTVPDSNPGLPEASALACRRWLLSRNTAAQPALGGGVSVSAPSGQQGPRPAVRGARTCVHCPAPRGGEKRQEMDSRDREQTLRPPAQQESRRTCPWAQEWLSVFPLCSSAVPPRGCRAVSSWRACTHFCLQAPDLGASFHLHALLQQKW